jgi:hypothetical protein
MRKKPDSKPVTKRRVSPSRTPEMSPSKKNREAAKKKGNEAIQKLRGKKEPRPRELAEPPIDSVKSAVRALVVPPEIEEPNGQQVIPGAGPARSVTEERPGDHQPYVLVLRMTRGTLRQLRIVTAHAGFKFPAQWVLDVMGRQMRAELATLEQRGGR